MDLINYPDRTVSASQLRDGKSNTLIFSENLLATVWYQVGPPDPTIQAPQIGPVPPPNPGTTAIINGRFGTTFVWCYASEPLPPSGMMQEPTRPAAALPAPHMKINGNKNNLDVGEIAATGANGLEWARPSSYHPGGVNAVFADGRTVFLNEEITYYVYQQLMTPHGTESDMPLHMSYVLDDADY
jgi:prepilin-type processing-associated H-X9-DG protein